MRPRSDLGCVALGPFCWSLAGCYWLGHKADGTSEISSIEASRRTKAGLDCPSVCPSARKILAHRSQFFTSRSSIIISSTTCRYLSRSRPPSNEASHLATMPSIGISKRHSSSSSVPRLPQPSSPNCRQGARVVLDRRLLQFLLLAHCDFSTKPKAKSKRMLVGESLETTSRCQNESRTVYSSPMLPMV